MSREEIFYLVWSEFLDKHRMKSRGLLEGMTSYYRIKDLFREGFDEGWDSLDANE